jgi:GNAT superfamily N-acetyltransferase
MTVQRYKRFRMEIDLRRMNPVAPQLPEGYRWVQWRPLLSERHAQVKWRCFRDDLDGQVFECLRDLQGCRRLIGEIGNHARFCPNATWMLSFQPEESWPADDCGTIQGLARAGHVGAIQNVGIAPNHRGMGLGRALVMKSLEGFFTVGMTRASLEVTALNQVAVRLYQSLGFKITRVLYRDAVGGRIVFGSERPPRPSEGLLSV